MERLRPKNIYDEDTDFKKPDIDDDDDFLWESRYQVSIIFDIFNSGELSFLITVYLTNK